MLPDPGAWSRKDVQTEKAESLAEALPTAAGLINQKVELCITKSKPSGVPSSQALFYEFSSSGELAPLMQHPGGSHEAGRRSVWKGRHSLNSANRAAEEAP